MRPSLIAVLLPTLALTGCLQSTAVIKLNADGSGTMENQSLMSSSALEQIRQMASGFGAAGAKPIDPFSEEQARTLATQMGDSVTLVSSAPLKTATAEGRSSVYKFMDITKLRVNQTPNMTGNTSIRLGGSDAGGGALGITLARTAGNTMLLTLHTPGDPLTTVSGQLGGLTRPGSPIPADQLNQLRPMLAGLRIALVVEPPGRLIRTNSPFVNGRAVTIFDIDLDGLTRDDEAFGRLTRATSPIEMMDALKAVPSVRVNTERDITIEFAP